MRVVLCQTDIAWEDASENHRRISALIESHAPQPSSLLILPEMFNTGFSMNSAKLAEPLHNSPTLAFLTETARQYACPIMAGILLNDNGTITNDAVLISENGELTARYSKIQPFSPCGERQAIAAGQRVVTAQINATTIAPFICYDLRFPELFRLATPTAEVLIVIANWPQARIEHKIVLLRARAVENQAYVIGVNRVGHDPNVAYNGQSTLISPQGEILFQANDQIGLHSLTLDLSTLRDWRAKFPALRDRRDPNTLSVHSI